MVIDSYRLVQESLMLNSTTNDVQRLDLSFGLIMARLEGIKNFTGGIPSFDKIFNKESCGITSNLQSWLSQDNNS